MISSICIALPNRSKNVTNWRNEQFSERKNFLLGRDRYIFIYFLFIYRLLVPSRTFLGQLAIGQLGLHPSNLPLQFRSFGIHVSHLGHRRLDQFALSSRRFRSCVHLVAKVLNGLGREERQIFVTDCWQKKRKGRRKGDKRMRNTRAWSLFSARISLTRSLMAFSCDSMNLFGPLTTIANDSKKCRNSVCNRWHFSSRCVKSSVNGNRKNKGREEEVFAFV